MAIETKDIGQQTSRMKDSIDTDMMLKKPLPEWRPILAQECQVYVLGENFIGKRFDHINFRYCEKYEAEEIVENNIYALLRTKYFKVPSEDADDRIQQIVKSFTANLMTTLMKVSLQDDPDCTKVSFLPIGCVAFRNGVYDFKNSKWLFKYEITKMPQIGNKMYSYSPDYLIMWYMNFDFDPLPIDMSIMTVKDMVDIFKGMCMQKETRNLCFELMYNISHDALDRYDEGRFEHLCQILGYIMLQDFCQSFVLLIGSGQNGKNSLLDGCFTNFVVPTPAANSLEDIENDRFITGALENKAHNIFLETSPTTHTESKMLKAITGSMYQSIESKGVQKYSGIINCKYVFSGNDQEKIKFSDTTTGFRRRINIFEIFYTWDSQKRFMGRGDYYDTTFSDDLRELKADKMNVTAFCYFAMLGLKTATNDFTTNFKFTHNDWKLKYSDVDLSMKDELATVSRQMIGKWMKARSKTDPDAKSLLFDSNGVRLYLSDAMKELGYDSYEELLTMMNDDEAASNFFANNDVFISTKTLQKILGDMRSTQAFNSGLKKLYNMSSANFRSLYNNTMYVKVSFTNDRMKVVDK